LKSDQISIFTYVKPRLKLHCDIFRTELATCECDWFFTARRILHK